MSNLGEININTWRDRLSALEAVLTEIDNDWANLEQRKCSLDNTLESLEEDLIALQTQASFIFSTKTETDDLTEQTVDLLKRWHLMSHAPSLTSLNIFALEYWGLNLPEETVQAVLISGVLGDVKNDLEYHNNMHFLKVLLQTIRLTAIHNDIYAGTARSFDDNQIALMLIAACVHDLGHDGLGNTVKGVFEQGRLEKRSVELAAPYLKAVGYEDEKDFQALRVMILCTEVTPLDDPGNSMNQMKAAYRYHFLGDKDKTHTLNLDLDLRPLQEEPDLTTMSLLLHEADIGTSAGLTYNVTRYETTIYMHEIDKKDAGPQQVMNFLNQICQRQMLSDAGRRLFAANLARIYALAEEDLKNGNFAFPLPEHSDFLLPYGAGSEGSKTIN